MGKVEEVFNKQGYDEKIKAILKWLAVAWLIRYGIDKEDLVLSTLATTYIHIAKEGEDSAEFIKNYFSVPVRFKETPDQLTAQYLWVVVPKNGGLVFEDIIHIPAQLNLLDLSNAAELCDLCLQILIHELNHCLKSKNYYKIVGDNKIDIASGLNHTVYDTTSEPYEIIEETYDALEEALNTLQEQDIFMQITGRAPVQYGSYLNSAACLRSLFEAAPELLAIIEKSQFDKTSDWIDYIGLDNANKIEALFRKEHEQPGTILIEGTREYDEFNAIVEAVKNRTKPRC